MDWTYWADLIMPVVKNIALALVVLVVGWCVIKRLSAWVGSKIDRSKMDVRIHQ